jgi:hypothetical protein
MNKDDDVKKKQLRRTHYDTQTCQKKLRNIVKDKIEKNEILTDKEREEWDELIANSFLSVGVTKTVYYDAALLRICFGSLHTFALRFSDWDDPVIFKYEGEKYSFPIKKLWEIFYDHCLELFPLALADAVRMSKESEEREKWDSYGFSSKRELNNDVEVNR